MRVCPICNETFTDDFKFCDLDGASLKRKVDAAGPSRANKAWSLLGVGLLLGAVAISATAIVFLPRAPIARVVPRASTPDDSAVAVNPEPVNPNTTGTAQVEQPESSGQQVTAALESKPKAKEFASRDDASSSEASSPKAAAQSSLEDASGADDKLVTPALEQPNGPNSRSKPVETVEHSPRGDPGVASGVDSKPLPAPADLKKDSKPQTRAVKDQTSSKDSSGNKKGEKEKKGGFLRVFKKIFGKD